VGVGGGCVVGVQQLDIRSLESFGLCGFSRSFAQLPLSEIRRCRLTG
jgi:hypothetical protein